MSDVLSKPPVLDFDALLAPISDENPAGESLRYSGLYDEINEARRADKDVNQGDWQTELKVADFRKVIDLAVPALTSQSKDVQVAAWLSEALVNQHGFTGLRDGAKLLSSLQDRFWDTAHPEIDEGDMEGRANAVSLLELKGALALKNVKITQGNCYSYGDWEDAKRFAMPDNFDSLDAETQESIRGQLEQAERDGRCNGEAWRKAVAQTRRQFCEETNLAIEECWAELKELNRVIEERYDRNQMPGLSALNKSLDDVHTQVKKLLEQKRVEEPDESDATGEYVDGEASDGSNGAVRSGGVGGPVQSRADALRRLGEIAAFFQRTEPHSPVALLVQRAVKWGNMPLEGWLRDVIKDENVLSQVKETLGLAAAGEYGGYESESAGYEEPAAETASSDW
jgi:type VI secretion system protein ImpA